MNEIKKNTNKTRWYREYSFLATQTKFCRNNFRMQNERRAHSLDKLGSFRVSSLNADTARYNNSSHKFPKIKSEKPVELAVSLPSNKRNLMEEHDSDNRTYLLSDFRSKRGASLDRINTPNNLRS